MIQKRERVIICGIAQDAEIFMYMYTVFRGLILKYVYVYCVYIHMCIYVCKCVCVYVCVWFYLFCFFGTDLKRIIRLMYHI